MKTLVFATDAQEIPMAGTVPVPVIVPSRSSSSAEVAGAQLAGQHLGWTFFGLIGWAFAIVGAADLALVWFPLGFGNPQWEFGTVTTLLDGLPVFVLGLGVLLSGAFFDGNRRLARGLATVFGVLAVMILVLAVLYATVVPLALSSVPDPQVRVGLIKAIAKTTMQAVVYPVAFGWIALKTFRVTALKKAGVAHD